MISGENGFKKQSQTAGDYAIVEADYNNKVDEIVRHINGCYNAGTREKLHIIFWYLVNNCKIELGENSLLHPSLRSAIYYQYKGKGLSGQEKYAPILIGKGVCLGFSEAFHDIAQRCGIDTELITGKHLGERTYLDRIPRWTDFKAYRCI